MRVNLNKTKMMVRGLEEKVTASKIDPCGVCGRLIHMMYSANDKTIYDVFSLLYKLREVGSRKVDVHDKGHPWPGQELCLRITHNFR